MRVVCVCLTADRPEMTQQAIAAFRAQQYHKGRKTLLVYNTGATNIVPSAAAFESREEIQVFSDTNGAGAPIGTLRNRANALAVAIGAKAICHWDSDDWSHPLRITEQIEALQAGHAVTGYNSVLFWEGRFNPGPPYGPVCLGCLIEPCVCRNEAWLYTHPMKKYMVGSSLCYIAEAWQKSHFPETSAGEDTLWQTTAFRPEQKFSTTSLLFSPRMLCRIHGGNTQKYDYQKRLQSECWQRVPQMNQWARGVLEC